MGRCVSPQAVRRFVLGRQGLWPGRRWRGYDGVAVALRTIEAVQVDPLDVVGRSHDLALHARVEQYRPDILRRLLYQERRFFDYGGVVFILPMDELKYFRTPMLRRRSDPRWQAFAQENTGLIDAVRAEVARRGPVLARELTATSRTVSTFRSGRNTSVALYYLWLTGELMTHSRRGFERVYDLRSRVVPAELDTAVDASEADEFFARKALSFRGITSERGWLASFNNFSQRKFDRAGARQMRDQLVREGAAVSVEVAGQSEEHYIPAADEPLLDTVESGRVPDAWLPTDPEHPEQSALLAPLDIVSARGRARPLFDFDYIWEVYKPATKRKWGYYTLPVRYGDRLVARIDPRYDRPRRSLVINGLWLEETATGRDEDFQRQLADELVRLGELAGAEQHDLAAVQPRALARALEGKLRRNQDQAARARPRVR